jgi:hypothetical protein
MFKIGLLVVCGLILQSYGYCKGLTEDAIDLKLMELKPLPKVHYYWPVSLDVSDRQLYELARITHSVCMNGPDVTQNHVDRCVYVCARVNKTLPAIKCSIGINFSPWHMKFDPNLPPTDRGASYMREISFFEERCSLIKKWIEQSNEKYQSSVEVGAITLDTERFQEKPGDKSWNDAICEALDAIHKKAQMVFPQARIEWYGRGIAAGQSATGWSKTTGFTGREIKAPLSCSLYTVPEIERMRETYRRTAALADSLGIEDVTPWVALGAGCRRDIIKFEKWYFDWDYDIIYSWMLGAELNIDWYGERPERFAPYKRAKVVVFFPRPFDKRTPAWAKHFIAYVRGATSVQNLDDLVDKQ